MLCFAGTGQMIVADQVVSIDVRHAGAVGDGKTKDTAAFQKAIDDCEAAGGGEVVVPAGEYLIGSIALKSNTTLRLEKDANLTGTDDLDDYPIVKARWEGKWVDAHRALVSAQDASHIAVIGPGKISGNPALGGRRMPRRPCVLEPINCSDIRLEDFTATQRSMWTIHPTYCENLVAKNLTIRSIGGNSDGIDVDSCMHMRIENCDIDSGDDAIAIKSGRGMEGYRAARPSEDVLITGCTLGDANFACIGIGSETSGGIRNVRIEHCKFAHSKSYSIYIKSRPGRGAFIEDIVGKDLNVVSATGGFLRINLLNSGIQDPEPVTGEEGIPSARNFNFSDVKLADCGKLLDASAVPPEKPIEGLAIEDVSGTCQKGIVLVNIKEAVLRDVKVEGFKGPLVSVENVTGSGLDGAVPYKAETSGSKTSDASER